MLVLLMLSFLATSLWAEPLSGVTGLAGQVGNDLQERFYGTSKLSNMFASREPLNSLVMIREFYARRQFRPAWINDKGLLPEIDDLLIQLQEVNADDLSPDSLHVKVIKELLPKIEQETVANRTTPLLTDLDLLLTDSALTHGLYVLAGQIHAGSKDSEVGLGTGFMKTLGAALDPGRLRELLSELCPSQFERLKAALARYRMMEKKGEWPLVPPGVPLKKGDNDPRVAVLKQRLNAENGFNQPLAEGTIFDNSLEQNLIQAQSRLGISPSGILDDEAIKALNVPLETRIRQIQVNVERCRQLPPDMDGEHVFVNAADFKLSVIDHGKTVMETKVVVGKPYRRTPVFSSQITSVILNPSWRVPRKVALDVILPLAQKNPHYLADNNFVVYQGHEEDSPKVDPLSVDWTKITPANFNYRFFQQPGPANALGRIKFVFPNLYGVYLHDTPSRDLFKKMVRTFSAGCIRVEKPLDLAVYLLRDQPQWTRSAIEKAIKQGVGRQIALTKPFPIHVVYLTAWVGADGEVQFREDVYGRDRLEKIPPISPQSPQDDHEDRNRST